MSDYDFGAVMLQCEFPSWNKLLNQVDKNDLYFDKEENIDGYETEPHVTILYGLHENVNHDKVVSDIKKFKPTTIKLVAVDSFESADYDVLKINVDAAELLPYRKVLMNYKNTQSFPNYNPHITIAYLKKGKAKKYHNKNVDLTITCNEVKYSSPKRDAVFIKLQ